MRILFGFLSVCYSLRGTWTEQIFLKESLEKRRVLSEVFSSLASVTFFRSRSVTTQEYLSRPSTL